MQLTYTNAIVATLWLSTAVTMSAQTAPTEPSPPDYSVRVWATNVDQFNARVLAYFELRNTLQKGLVALKMTNDPADIERAEVSLAKRLRIARPRAQQGEFFTPAIEREFKKALIVEINANVWATIMDDNPGDFSHQINGAYDKEQPVSNVPPSILALLPALPAEIQYRFLGRHLILHDTRANVILDRIPFAIRCADCED